MLVVGCTQTIRVTLWQWGSSMDEEYCSCNVCSDEVLAEGTWFGDGWSEPREFEPFEDPLLCERCKEGDFYTITFKVVGYEDFSKMSQPRHWRDWFEGFDSVHIQSVEVKLHE
jgi:hypothetical protein